MSTLDSNLNISWKGKFYTNYNDFRNAIIAENPYDSSVPYQDNTPTSLKQVGNYVNVIPQLNGIGNISNSLISRGIVSAGGGNLTNLEQIGSQMLIKQLSYDSAAHLAQQYLPSVDLSKILKWQNPLSFPTDYGITKDINANLFEKIISTAFYSTNYITNANPLSANPTNDDYLKNTGKGQLIQFFRNINLNVYKSINQDGTDSSNTISTINSDSAYQGVKLTRQSDVVLDKIYFNFDSKEFHPYNYNHIYSPSYVVYRSNIDMFDSFTTDTTTDEYAPSQDIIDSDFGITNKTPQKGSIDLYNVVNSVDSESINNKLVWGRDGVSDNAKSVSSYLHGNTTYEQDNLQLQSSVLNTDFNVKRGILEYTKNLLNATSGHYIDITKKAFVNGNDVIGFNGNPLWQSNNSQYANVSGNLNYTGIRQHSVIDQYDRYAKTLRYVGNIAYGGNENSVIHQSVMPRIHPTRDDKGNIDSKNLMFSIENLAIGVIKDPKSGNGIIDDEFGSPIPSSEVGPFSGRIMWFPPYDMQLNETASAKFEPTVMLGRNEPMYNYMNSERSATLSFVMLMDYPEQLKNYIGNPDYKKKVADFFAFGGDPLNPSAAINDLQLRINVLKNEINTINGTNNTYSEPPTVSESFIIYFQNDVPTDSQVNTTMNYMYNNPLHYEISTKVDSAQEGRALGLNSQIYYFTGLTESTGGKYVKDNSNVDQYNIGQINQQDIGDGNSQNYFNQRLKDIFGNEEFRQYYSVNFVGNASKLYENKSEEADYNYQLGFRRGLAARKFFEARLKAVLNISNLDDFDLKDPISQGSSVGSSEGADKNNINLDIVKRDRTATILIARNSRIPTPPQIKSIPINGNLQSSSDITDISEKQKEIDSLQSKIDRLNSNNGSGDISDNIYSQRKFDSKGVLNQFENIKENYYSPANHSQTPEDFHKRLTFLQQCVRQGAAKRYDIIDDNGEIQGKNSVFGKQPICILRIGDFFYTKIVIDNITIDYNDSAWDMNPEGFGMQPMMAKITMQMKIIGGQSLKGPIDALQNAVSFNYYANSTYTSDGMYKLPTSVAENQSSYTQGILNGKNSALLSAFNAIRDSQNNQNNGTK